MTVADLSFRALSRRRILGMATAIGGCALLRPLGVRAEPSGPVRSMLELRHENAVVQKWDLSCGAAALATILQYQHDDPVTERELVKQLINRDIYLDNPEIVQIRQGFSLLDLKRVVDERGYTGIGYGDLSFDDALGLAPVITPVRTHGYNHFVVLIGRIGESIQVVDPAFGNVTMTVARFKRIWMKFPTLGCVGFVVARGNDPSPPGHLRPDPRVFMTPPPGMIRNALF